MKLTNYLLIIAFIVSLTGSAFAQNNEEDSKPVKPDKIKTAWSAGVSGGAAGLMSDVRFRFKGYGINVNVNKALSSSMALRMRLGFGTAYGLSNIPATGATISKNTAINGTDPKVNYNNPAALKSGVYNNFKTNYKEAYIEVMYFFPFTDFRKNEHLKSRIYIFAGGGGFIYNTKIDQLDANGNMYNYQPVSDMTSEKDRIKELKKMLDGTYETKAEVDPNHNTSFLGGSIIPSLDAGLGFSYHMSPKIDMFLEAAYTYTNNDLVDGVRWQNTGSLTSGDDALLLLAVGLNYRFGKAENIYWFDNPEAMHYKVTLQNQRKVDLLTSDKDADGISDYFDKDPETPSGIATDGSGKPLDIDKDGIADYLDKEPFTDRNAIVDSTGVAIDSDGDGVPDIRDLEPNTPANTLVNFQGKSIKKYILAEIEKSGKQPDVAVKGKPDVQPGKPPVVVPVIIPKGKPDKEPEVADKGKTDVKPAVVVPVVVPKGKEKEPEVVNTGTITILGFIPVVFFDFNQAFVKADYYNAALELADAMKHYPNDKLRIIGHTDATGTPEYNVELGKKRAQAVADILVACGIDKNRLIIVSKGSDQPLSVIDKRDMDQLNRRVQFEVVSGGTEKKENEKDQKTAPPKTK